MDTQSYYYLISHHNTVVYVDAASRCLRHAPLGTAPLNLLLEIEGERARLVMKDERSGHFRQLSIEHPSGKINEHMGDAELDCRVETFDGGAVGLRVREQYVSADSDGRVRNDRDWCREWERYLPLTMDTVDTLLLLKRNSWLSHSDRRILSLGDEDIDLRTGFSFGPAKVRFLSGNRCFVSQTDSKNAVVPSSIHIVDQAGVIHTFSLFRPLIYYCVYGHDTFYECLHLSLQSLAKFGCFSGALGVASDRSGDSLLKYVPEAFHERLLTSEASKERGWFNRYFLDHDLYDAYQPILYCDVDLIFDADITNLLIEIALSGRVCCGTEDRAHPNLADRSVRQWDDWISNYFGRQLFDVDQNYPDARVALGNSGEIGFRNTALIQPVNELVKMIATRLEAEEIRIWGDQPILNYVLHKTQLGDFELVNRYRRLTRSVAEVPPAGRKGIVHFNLASGDIDVSAKAAALKSYLNELVEYVGKTQGSGGGVLVNSSILIDITPSRP
jgi:hypothetical protein